MHGTYFLSVSLEAPNPKAFRLATDEAAKNCAISSRYKGFEIDVVKYQFVLK
jgi:hypothetical protein